MKPVAVLVPLVPVAVSLLVNVSGEYCHGWRDSRGQWTEGFYCPERTDKTESVFCCGHCDLRYCCRDGQARLDQGNCGDFSRAKDTHMYEDTAELPVYVPFLIVVCVFMVFILVGSVVAICFCLNQKPIPPARRSQSLSQAPPSPLEATETLPMTASTGTSCGSSSSLYPLSSAPHNHAGQLHFKVEQQHQAPPSSFHPPPNPAFHRTMTLPAMMHPLMFPTTMINPYMMPKHGPRPYRSVPSPCPPNTGPVKRSSEVIV